MGHLPIELLGPAEIAATPGAVLETGWHDVPADAPSMRIEVVGRARLGRPHVTASLQTCWEADPDGSLTAHVVEGLELRDSGAAWAPLQAGALGTHVRAVVRLDSHPTDRIRMTLGVRLVATRAPTVIG